jgi:hypothetical protein
MTALASTCVQVEDVGRDGARDRTDGSSETTGTSRSSPSLGSGSLQEWRTASVQERVSTSSLCSPIASPGRGPA